VGGYGIGSKDLRDGIGVSAMTLDQFRPHVKGVMDPFVTISLRIGLTPNIFTIISFLGAVGAGIAFFYQNVPAGVFLVMVNAACDAMDGALARAMETQSVQGDFLDHVVDRYADIFIITGIFAGGYAPWWIGVIALTGVLMSSYLGTQAQAVGVGRFYGGVLGRADRLLLTILAGVFTILLPAGVFGLSYLGWLLVIFGVFGHLTAIQRFVYTWRQMAIQNEEDAAK
jgi:archaetidylinositol phosphate synthase